MEVNPTTCMSTHGSTLSSQEEESGWTLYFEDFLSHDTTATANNDEHTTPSLIIKPHPCCQVSDATSAVKKLSVTESNDQLISIKKLGSFKKRRSTTYSHCRAAAAAALVIDDALEDTATSPANSPKLCHLNQQFTNRKWREFSDISEQKGVNRSARDSAAVDERMTDLKKRGLCLVPVSSLTNYISGL